ncbi:SMC-Scp complex subunit ScpB [Candidatus Poriferisodalis sp.]|uniref:SMC-Scp complex subunit ScpB n=1 Tax=Candidatus Poriferisodalis sp. TaxID=3101277 RepID=UPI003B01B33D
MSAGGPLRDLARSLRLVSDEGRTVADPSAQPRTQQPSAPPPHPSMPASSSHSSRDKTDTLDGFAESAAESLSSETRLDESRSFDDHELYAAIEAVLIVATEPVPAEVLASVTAAPLASVAVICDELAREYAAAERGFALVRIAGGYRVQSSASCAEYVERFVGGRRPGRLSAAAMETLAVVAYKQPISRAQISAIRGVNADGVVRTLADQGYLAEVGRDPGPGTASLLGTTDLFLERLGLDRLDDLPSLAELSVDPDAVEAMDRLAAGQGPSGL